RDTGAWLNEGLATYIEPIVRARAGWRSVASVWQEWLQNMPRGLDAMGKTGLAHAGRGGIYWGGALFMLQADIAIRQASGNRLGLRIAWPRCCAGAATRAPAGGPPTCCRPATRRSAAGRSRTLQGIISRPGGRSTCR